MRVWTFDGDNDDVGAQSHICTFCSGQRLLLVVHLAPDYDRHSAPVTDGHEGGAAVTFTEKTLWGRAVRVLVPTRSTGAWAQTQIAVNRRDALTASRRADCHEAAS